MPTLREETVPLHCGGLRLDARLATAPGATLGCVVCHPHPLYGGNMHNAVVVAVCAALGAAGLATLRFDFRGTGRSEGSHSGGRGEIEDASAAIDLLGSVAGIRSVAIAGYSFGAAVAMQAGVHRTNTAAVAAIAPPLALLDAPADNRVTGPLLVVAGDRDGYCPTGALEAFARARPGIRLEVLRAADHFLAGREPEVAAIVSGFLAPLAAAGTAR